MNEIILVDKPKGITSFDVIRQLRRKLGIKKMGHAGTLDPLASGLMIIGVNKGTKKLTEFIKLDKVYEVDVLLGVKTSTGDMEGEVLESKEVKELDIEKVKKVLDSMVGKLILPVPAYSAIKVKGQPLYKRARQGEKFIPPKREMEVFSVCLTTHHPLAPSSPRRGETDSHRQPPRSQLEGGSVVSPLLGEEGARGWCVGVSQYIIKLKIKVSSGTYIRSLAEEIGLRLGYPATVRELRRTSIGEFRVEKAEGLDLK